MHLITLTDDVDCIFKYEIKFDKIPLREYWYMYLWLTEHLGEECTEKSESTTGRWAFLHIFNKCVFSNLEDATFFYMTWCTT